MHLAAVPTFGLLLLVGIPAILVVCYGFHLVFEAPFIRRRGASAVRAMPIVGRLLPQRRNVRVYVPTAAPSEVLASHGEARS
jgi:hypothetical protein